MKAAFVKVPFQFELRDLELREITKDEALVKIVTSGVCGTDMHTASFEATDWMPFGHEVTGVVVKVGENVKSVSVGDRVTLESGSYCGECELCKNGRSDLCNGARNIFAGETMGFAQYIIAPKQSLVPIGNLSFEEATLIEPMGVALDLSYTADIKLNDDVLVIGVGPIGLMAIRIAKAMGARKVYAASKSTSRARIELAKKFGADDVILTDKIDLTEYPFPRKGLDKILVTAPPKLIEKSIKIANIGATIAYIGIKYGEDAYISFDANDFHFKKLQLRASYAAPALYFPRCIDFINIGLIDAKSLISHRFKLNEIEKAINTVSMDKENVVKAIIVNEE
jgi:L-iditol 2-dehydrogenase